ncbi:MAG: peptidoglycan binding protein CsiV [Gammaproteobacteria bacterium]|nr:peptidoglycan binding protein CsiV [Gammaproteobacteria bacterium]
MQTLNLRPCQCLLACLLACLGSVIAPLCLAQEEQRWFRVELMVFTQQGADSGEQWDPTPTLVYPDAGRFLVKPAQVTANLELYRADSIVDAFGRQILTERAQQETSTDIGIPRDTVPAIPADPNRPQPLQPATAVLYPTPFVALPAAQQEFRGKAAYMQRSGRYRVLFHETWAQPVLSREQSLPLILDRSGDTGQWPELQGSINIHLSRYLHLETNLWLNTTGDYLSGEWRMPPPPLGPPSLIVEQLPPEEDARQGFGEQWLDQQVQIEENTGEDALLAAEPEEETGPVYPYRHAVVLQQQRRMRSDEVHYLDHPMLGVVIKFLPLSEEELESLALAEADSGFRLDHPLDRL